MKKILVIAAHPDDEVYGMGGTVARLADEGNEVHLLIVTDGSTAQYRDDPRLPRIIEKKKQETEAAAAALGFVSVRYGNMPDMKLDVTPHIEVNAVIEKTIDELEPDTVYTHFWGDVNSDHAAVYRSTAVAVRPAPGQVVHELYCYAVPSSTEWNPYTPATSFLPNVFVDISRYTDKKAQAIASYNTEIRKYPHPRSAEYVNISDTAEGLKCGMPPTECFMMLRKMI